MNLYIVEAPIKNAAADEPPWQRQWVASAGQAAKVRAELTSKYGVARKDIRTTQVDVSTKKEGLLEELNKTSAFKEDYLYGN